MNATFQTKTTTCLAAVVGAILSHAALAQTITVTDGTFANWVFGSYGTDEDAGGLMAVTTMVGHPRPAVLCTTTSASSSIGYCYGVDTNYVTSAPLEGLEFTFSIVFENGPGAFGAGEELYLVVSQGGDSWYLPGPGTGLSTKWKTRKFKGALKASKFELLGATGSGPKHPDFTSGVPTQFGFGGLAGDSGTFTMYYDNFSLTIQ